MKLETGRALKSRCLGWALAGLAFVAAQAFAAEQVEMSGKTSPAVAASSSVVVHLEQFKVLPGAEGKESLVDAKTVKPGDVVEYRATYTNRDSKPVSGLQATLPIPEGMAYLPKTARPGGGKVLAATLDGRYSAEPLMRQVRVNGSMRTEAVPYVQYRSLRWDLGQLQAGAEQTVTARMQVESLAAGPKK